MTLVFLLLPFDTPTWQCCLVWQWKRKRECFWLTWFIFVFLQRASFVICHLKMQGNLRGKSISHFALHSLPPLALRKHCMQQLWAVQHLGMRSTSSFTRMIKWPAIIMRTSKIKSAFLNNQVLFTVWSFHMLFVNYVIIDDNHVMFL